MRWFSTESADESADVAAVLLESLVWARGEQVPHFPFQPSVSGF